MSMLECIILMNVQVTQHLERTPEKLKDEHDAQEIMDRIRND